MAGLDIPVILAFAFGIIILYIVGRILFVPLKFVFRLLINGLVGGLLLWLINIVGEAFGFAIAINPVTALVAGILGVPGVVLLIALKYVLGVS
ncbi:MAG TPA: pro-sigmaK processing inhibitor BofA [Thermoanaerobacterales bacterium]|nr:pro-sigmaK processing inhibitor BofA [Thermoanaerobacterales bacterium]